MPIRKPTKLGTTGKSGEWNSLLTGRKLKQNQAHKGWSSASSGCEGRWLRGQDRSTNTKKTLGRAYLLWARRKKEKETKSMTATMA